MGKIIKRAFGALTLLLGVSIALWIAYNLFIQRMPETKDRPPIAGFLVAMAFIFWGWKWLRSQPTT